MLAVSAPVQHQLRREAALDEALAESFPASDPPAWTPGVVRPVPLVRPVPAVRAPIPDAHEREPGRPFAQVIVSIAGAAGLALLVPVAILLVGLPIVLAVRGLVELFGWVAATFI